MDDQAHEQKHRPLIWFAILLTTAVAVIAIIARRWQRLRAERLPPERPPAPPVIPPDIEGLTEDEAEARHLEGEDNVIHFQPPRSWQEIWRDNAYTIFNLSLVGLAGVQFLLGLPLDALLSLGMIVLNIGLNAAQELIASRQLQEVERATRPQATVIRERKARSIDPSEIVRGDVLVVGPGDQFLVDGKLVTRRPIVVDESMLTGESARRTVASGEAVFAGSFCVSGRAAFEVEKVGSERLVVSLTEGVQGARETLTPLEQVVDRVLRWLLLVVAVITIMLVFRYFQRSEAIDVDVFADVANVVFSIAPASLFFMIFLTYASGRADLAKVGALVHRSRSVESLAQSTVICFAQAGILTGTSVEIEPAEPRGDEERLAESRVRQILGDFARSSSTSSLATQAMVATFEGNRRAVPEEAPFLSVYGWSAVAFDDDDLRGVYVLGDPDLLEAYLIARKEKAVEAEVEEGASPLATLRRRLPSLGRFLKRSDKVPPEGEPTDEALEAAPSPEESVSEPDLFRRLARRMPRVLHQGEVVPSGEEIAPTEAIGEEAPKPDLFRRLAQRMPQVLRRREEPPAEEEAIPDKALEEVVYLFAYYPEPVPLHAEGGVPQLPDGLIPLCRLRYTEQVRPEAIETIQTFSQTGVRVKVFTVGAPDRTVAILQEAGLEAEDGKSLRLISGPELAGLDPEELARAASENTVFGRMAPGQAQKVVAALRAQGESVTVAGDGVNDLPSMQQANLSIARQSSSQAALGVADIVLLEDSPQVLLAVLEKGQRIVHGLLDVLKLYLNQVFYLVLLILAIRILSTGFPYESKQGSLIGIVTLSAPSLGLALWAATGVLPRTNLGRLLAWFVAPSAITTGLIGLAVYWLFLDRTGDVAYAQLALTYTLVVCGLVLVILIRPPWRTQAGSAFQGGDWRPAVLILVLLVVFFLMARIPLAKHFFLLEPLRQPADYLVVGMAVLAWVFLLVFVWWVISLRRQRWISST